MDTSELVSEDERPLSAAFVGTGKIASTYAVALHELGEIALTAACDVDLNRANAFSQLYDIPSIYSSLDTMLERESPDLVVVCSPPGTHADVTVSSLQSGSSVLCEKPLCGSLRDLDRIQEAERSGGAFCATVAQLRFGAAAQHMRGLITSGELGDPLVAICHTLWHRDDDYYTVAWRGRWATELGGVTLNLGIHEIDLLLWLLGDWREVTAMTATSMRDIEVEDLSIATVHFESKAVASIVNSVLSPREESYLRIDCERATVELNHLYGYVNEDLRITVSTAAGGGANAPSQWGSIQGDHRGEIATQVREVVRCLREGARPPVTTEDARKTIDFITSIYKASALHEPVWRGAISNEDPFYHGMANDFGAAHGE